MQEIHLEHQQAIPVDEATKAAIEAAQAEVRRGNTYTMEEARVLIREQHKAWRKTQEEILTA